MNVIVRDTEEGMVIKISGELDHHGAKKVLKEIADATEELVPTICTLDMSGVTFMDSSGIAVVLGLYRKMSEVGGKVVVMDAPPNAMKVFNAAGLDRIVTFERERDTYENK